MTRSALCLILCVMVLPKPMLQSRKGFRLVQEWINLDFKFPTEADKIDAVNRRHFVEGSSVPIDVDVQFKQDRKTRVFLTTPRLAEGRPFTLGVIGPNGVLEPYPSYDWHKNQGDNCDGLTSVYRTAIDECNRLWVLDSGKFKANLTCSPQVLAFDLNTDRLVYRHRISPSSITQSSILITPAVDVGETCDDVFLYLADVAGFGLVVVDAKNRKDWRVTHRLFYPFPSRGSFFIQGLGFDLMSGIFGLALSPRGNSLSARTLYFHALASTTENYVSTAILKNSTLFLPAAPPNSIQVFPYERDSQSGAEAIDKNGIMYFGLMEPPRVACWNTATPFKPKNIHIIAEDKDNLQFISGLKIVNNRKGGQELWVMAAGFQRVMNNKLNTDSPNFKISAANVNDIVRGSGCESPEVLPAWRDGEILAN